MRPCELAPPLLFIASLSIVRTGMYGACMQQGSGPNRRILAMSMTPSPATPWLIVVGSTAYGTDCLSLLAPCGNGC